jgi:transposase
VQIIEHEDLAALQRLAKKQRNARVHQRFRGVILARQGQTSEAIGMALGVSSRSVRDWVRRYNEGGAPGLGDQPGRGRPPRLPPEYYPRFRERLDGGAQADDGICTLRGVDIQCILEKEFGVVYSVDGVYRLLHRLGYSSLMPRPRHARADPGRQEAFKKSAR